MKLTIGIPNYNGGELLKQTILSCESLDLVFEEYEILVVDNLSNDNSIEIIKELSEKYRNIRLVVNSENVGRIGNWNRVLELSKGDSILILMVGDKLKKINYDNYFKDLELNQALVFGAEIGNKVTNHWAQKSNTFLDVNIVLRETFLTLGHHYGLTPLQTHILSKNVIDKYNLRFEEKYEFLADLNFLNKYISFFDEVKFIDNQIIKWWDGKEKTTFKKQLLMFEDYLVYFPLNFKKYTGKNINLFMFNIFIINQIFFIFINNIKLGNKGFKFTEIISFINKRIGNLFYIFSLVLFPFYILYLIFNIKYNFRYPIKF